MFGVSIGLIFYEQILQMCSSFIKISKVFISTMSRFKDLIINLSHPVINSLGSHLNLVYPQHIINIHCFLRQLWEIGRPGRLPHLLLSRHRKRGCESHGDFGMTVYSLPHDLLSRQSSLVVFQIRRENLLPGIFAISQSLNQGNRVWPKDSDQKCLPIGRDTTNLTQALKKQCAQDQSQTRNRTYLALYLGDKLG